MNNGRGYGGGRGRGKGRGTGKGMGRGYNRGSGWGQWSAPLRDSTLFDQLHNVSSKILALKSQARVVVNRLRGIDDGTRQSEAAIPSRSALVQDRLTRPEERKRVSPTMIAVVDQERCVRCGLCVDVCPEHAVSMNNDEVTIDSDRCVACGVCVDECASEAISLAEKNKEAAS